MVSLNKQVKMESQRVKLPLSWQARAYRPVQSQSYLSTKPPYFLPSRFLMLSFSVDKAKLEMYCICRLKNNRLPFKYSTFILKRKHLWVWCKSMQCLCKRMMRRWGKCCTVLYNYNPEVSNEIFSRTWRVCKFSLNIPETFLWPLPRPHYKVQSISSDLSVTLGLRKW